MSLLTSVHLHLDTYVRQQRSTLTHKGAAGWRRLRVSGSLWLDAYAIVLLLEMSCQHQHGSGLPHMGV